MQDIISNDMMRRADRYTIDTLGVSGEELMLRASRIILEEVKSYRHIAIIAGKGNNGGDGICLAMLLIEQGAHPDLYMFSRETRGESRYYYDQISEYDGIKVIDGSEDYSSYDVVVDAIFGTGLCREVEGLYRDTIEHINSTAHYVVSVDIPSGLNGDNGIVCGVAVHANKTVSINTLKLGQYLASGKDYVGEVLNGDIGIKMQDKPYHLVEESDIVLPRRRANSHKGTYGQISIIGGSICYQGAPKLAAMGSNAMMSGAGLVRLCVPREYIDLYGKEVIESTLYPMTSVDGAIVYSESDLEPLLTSESIAIGVGIGRGEDNIKIIDYLMHNYHGRLVVDADGLNALATNMDVMREHTCDVVLTPHVKEMSRLLGESVSDILEHPVESATRVAREYSVVVLLKGTSTIVTDGDQVFVVDRGSAGMAKGGSGDVLTGVTAGLLGNSALSTIEATYYASYIAGMAGELASEEYGTYGAMARDTARNVSRVMASLER